MTTEPSSDNPIADVITQPMPPAIATVRHILTATLEAEPSIEDTLTLTEALDLLLDVEPPFPPLDEDDESAGNDDVLAALVALDIAADGARSVRELTRYTAIAMLLQRLDPAEVRL